MGFHYITKRCVKDRSIWLAQKFVQISTFWPTQYIARCKEGAELGNAKENLAVTLSKLFAVE